MDDIAPSKVTSFPRKRESILSRWTPAFAGVTTAVTFISIRGPRAHVHSDEGISAARFDLTITRGDD